MTWTKLGSELLDDADDLSADAGWLHVQALLYSNRAGLDLDVPKAKLVKFAHSTEPHVLAELVGSGWWEDRGSSYFIGCYRPEWQLPKDVVEHRRQQNATRQERKRRHDAGDHSLCTDRCPENNALRHALRGALPGTERNGTERNGREGSERPSECWGCGHREVLNSEGYCRDGCRDV